MNRSRLFPLFFVFAAAAGPIYADAQAEDSPEPAAVVTAEKTSEESQDLKAEQIAMLSEAFGHMLAQHVKTLGIQFDIAQLVKGMQDAEQGKPSPMEDAKCIEALTTARQQSFLRLAKENLQKAESFIQETAKKDGVRALEDGKLYYRVERDGNGAEVAQGNSPLIRYKGSFIDGTVFGASKEEDLVVLEETIPGFSRGLVGMKEGEKRTLYIHPDLAYGTNGQLPPNSLLVFEIEVIKANASTGNTESISSAPQNAAAEKEISQSEIAPASKSEGATAIR